MSGESACISAYNYESQVPSEYVFSWVTMQSLLLSGSEIRKDIPLDWWCSFAYSKNTEKGWPREKKCGVGVNNSYDKR